VVDPNELASIEVRKLEASDRQFAAIAEHKLSGMSSLAVVIGIGLALGAWYMNSRGQTSDAVACGVGAPRLTSRGSDRSDFSEPGLASPGETAKHAT